MESTFFATASDFLTRLLGVLSVYYLLRGHDAPGGGFVGGLVLASAIVLRAFSHGVTATRALVWVDPRTLIGAGIALALAAACAGPLAGEALLEPLVVAAAPALGTPLLFDLGVYVLVAGATLTLLLSLIEED